MSTFILLVTNKIEFTINLRIILLVFFGYAFIGFLDDYLSLKHHANEGLTAFQKLFLQLIIAVGFFYMYISNGGQTALIVSTLGIHIEMGWLYGIFLLFVSQDKKDKITNAYRKMLALQSTLEKQHRNRSSKKDW